MAVKKRQKTSGKAVSGLLAKALAALLLAALSYQFLAQSVWAAGANSGWGNASSVTVALAVNSGQGTDTAAWDSAARADKTNGLAWMSAVGDGTYQYALDLIPSAQYNYLFFASATAVNSAFARQGEPVPNNGSDAGTFMSLSSTTITLPTSGSLLYGNITGGGLNQGGARRLLTMPNDTDLPAGSTLYVFNNFASTPTGVANYTAQLTASTTVKLDWKGAAGYWGNASPAWDIIGGKYYLYRSTTASTGPYTLLASLAGEVTTYTDQGPALQSGVTAYYVFVSSDAYNGPTNPTTKTMWPNLARFAPGQAGFAYDENEFTNNDKKVKPAVPVRVIFKVENIDEEYVLEHHSIVYLTPWEEDGKVYPNKTPGTFMRVVIPKS